VNRFSVARPLSYGPLKYREKQRFKIFSLKQFRRAGALERFVILYSRTASPQLAVAD